MMMAFVSNLGLGHFVYGKLLHFQEEFFGGVLPSSDATG